MFSNSSDLLKKLDNEDTIPNQLSPEKECSVLAQTLTYGVGSTVWCAAHVMEGECNVHADGCNLT